MTPQEMAQTHTAAFTQSRPWTAAEFADLLANPFAYIVGSRDSFALFQVIADEAELLTIATHPAHQRQGLGLQCMTDWHANATTLGATRAFLEVAADNLPAIALYEQCGYRPCGLRKGYYPRESGKNCDAIVMEHALHLR